MSFLTLGEVGNFHHGSAGVTVQILPTPSTRLCKSLEKCGGAHRASGAQMIAAPAEIDELTERVIGCAIEVHRSLGPGLLESVYRECMVIEMRSEHLLVESER